MPELNPFDTRLEAEIRAFADRALTSVDAAAMAEHATRHRRAGRLSWHGVVVPVPVSILIVLALLLAALALSLGAGAPWSHQGSVLPIALASPTAAAPASHTPSPTPRPTPTVAPDAPAYATGTGSSTVQSPGTTTLDAKGIAHTQDVVIELTADMDDPRVTGTGTYQLAIDASGAFGFASGSLRLITADGAWEGSCTGSTWNDLRAGDLSCWLVGSAAHAGLTYYLDHRFGAGSEPDAFLGVILASTPPSP
jgi:hypothetical protein